MTGSIDRKSLDVPASRLVFGDALKLQAEREISTNAALFAEAGYIRLTAGETHTLPGVDYGALNLTNLALGLRMYL